MGGLVVCRVVVGEVRLRTMMAMWRSCYSRSVCCGGSSLGRSLTIRVCSSIVAA